MKETSILHRLLKRWCMQPCTSHTVRAPAFRQSHQCNVEREEIKIQIYFFFLCQFTCTLNVLSIPFFGSIINKSQSQNQRSADQPLCQGDEPIFSTYTLVLAPTFCCFQELCSFPLFPQAQQQLFPSKETFISSMHLPPCRFPLPGSGSLKYQLWPVSSDNMGKQDTRAALPRSKIPADV